MEVRERIKGALIGIAYGDSFGMPVEMWTPSKIKKEYGTINDFSKGHPDNTISSKLVRGEVTDDTINSIMVIEMLFESNGKVDVIKFFDKLTAWINVSEKSSTVVGPSTAKAIELIKAGVPMEETGKTGTTNGGAMKILPVGLVAGLRASQKGDSVNEEELINQVVALCKPTHYTGVAISAACAVAAGGAISVCGEKSIDIIYKFMQKISAKGSTYGMQWGGPSIAKRMELAKYFIKNDPQNALDNIYEYVGTSIASTESIPAALALFYMAEGDPLVCARYAANIGGDTDTIGAIACGLCGAFSGYQVFPAKNIKMLEQVNQISFDILTEKLMACV